MAEKPWGKTVLGWFVVKEGGAAAAPADTDSLIEKYANEPAPAPIEVKLNGPLTPVVAGQIDFVKVYESGGSDAQERDRVSKARELLRSLPAETPAPVKKQIVEASLKAFGVPTDKIIEGAVEQLQVLEAYLRAGQGDTQGLLVAGAAKIADLEKQIAEVKQTMEQAVREQETRAAATNQEKLGVQQVLEFFGQEAVAKVVHDSPKLVEPK